MQANITKPYLRIVGLIYLVVLGVGGSLLFPYVTATKKRYMTKQSEERLLPIYVALVSYANKNHGRLPDNLQLLVTEQLLQNEKLLRNADNATYNYTSGLATSSNSACVLVYEEHPKYRSLHAVLDVGGRVAVLDKGDFQKALEHTQSCIEDKLAR